MIDTCSMPILLANICLLYTMSCIYYLYRHEISEHHSINHCIIFNVK